jgi:large conductance mechanosensitive channel
MIKGFRDFIMRGNVIDLAVAVVIGAAFTAVVTSISNNLIQPFVNAIGGGDGSSGLSWQLTDNAATTIDLSAIIGALINFLIVAAVVYFIFVAPMNHMRERRARGQEPEPEAVPEDVQLLKEIRDELRAQNGGARVPSSSSPRPTQAPES